ncbi:MAG: helicase-related protein, partial [Blastocatellales bacterium]
MAEPLEIELDEATIETAEEISTREGIYGEIKRLLIARGIPANEIAFIHDFPTPARKAQAFAEVNAGRIRVMIASTEKAGTGVNMQERLYALHHLDTPWRPSDVEQREGRILRQGNIHKEVHLCQYITEGSFDGYMWQTLESKSRFISQIMAGEVTARTAEDVDQLVMTAAQIKAIASGNPLILEKVAAEVELTRLERLYSVWRGNRRRLQNQLELLPADLQHLARAIAGYQQAVTVRDQFAAEGDTNEFRMMLKKSISAEEEITLTERQRAGAHLRQLAFALARQAQSRGRLTHVIGNYRGFEIIASSAGRGINALSSLFAETETALRLPGSESAYHFNLGESDLGIIQSLDAQ